MLKRFKKNGISSSRIFTNNDKLGFSSNLDSVALDNTNVKAGLLAANVVNYIGDIEQNALISDRPLNIPLGNTIMAGVNAGVIVGLIFELTIPSENPSFRLNMAIDWEYCSEQISISGLADKGEFLKLALLAIRPILQIDAQSNIIDSGLFQIAINRGLPKITFSNDSEAIIGSLSFLNLTEKPKIKMINDWLVSGGMLL